MDQICEHLDGMNVIDSITVLITNNKKKIPEPEKLLRGGRNHLTVSFENVSEETAKQIFDSYYPTASSSNKKKFSTKKFRRNFS